MSADPVERYSQLSPATRKWLETPRREDDWQKLDAAIKFYDRAATNGRFVLWLIGSIVAVFVTAVTLGEQIIKAVIWFRGPR